jgi:hypothetical protein
MDWASPDNPQNPISVQSGKKKHCQAHAPAEEIQAQGQSDIQIYNMLITGRWFYVAHGFKHGHSMLQKAANLMAESAWCCNSEVDRYQLHDHGPRNDLEAEVISHSKKRFVDETSFEIASIEARGFTFVGLGVASTQEARKLAANLALALDAAHKRRLRRSDMSPDLETLYNAPASSISMMEPVPPHAPPKSKRARLSEDYQTSDCGACHLSSCQSPSHCDSSREGQLDDGLDPEEDHSDGCDDAGQQDSLMTSLDSSDRGVFKQFHLCLHVVCAMCHLLLVHLFVPNLLYSCSTILHI